MPPATWPRSAPPPSRRSYVTDRRDLLYREPAFTDALLMTYPDSEQLVAICTAATEITTTLLQQGQDTGVVRQDFTVGDLYYADVATGLALRTLPKPARQDYDRRTSFFLDSIAVKHLLE